MSSGVNSALTFWLDPEIIHLKRPAALGGLCRLTPRPARHARISARTLSDAPSARPAGPAPCRGLRTPCLLPCRSPTPDLCTFALPIRRRTIQPRSGLRSWSPRGFRVHPRKLYTLMEWPELPVRIFALIGPFRPPLSVTWSRPQHHFIKAP